MKFRPCIDLHSGKVKQIVGSSLSDTSVEENFVSEEDASYFADLYRKNGLTGGHVIMLGEGNEGQVIKALKAYPGGLQVGGGINKDNANCYLEQGASHVIVTSAIFSEGQFKFAQLKEIVKMVGKDRLVIDLSCRRKDDDYYVVTNRWQNFTEFVINKENLDMLSAYCDEFLIHAVDVEGMCNGIEETLLALMADIVTIPCTYAGGIRSIKDIEIINIIGKGKIDYTVGSALDIFGGDMKFEDLK